MVDSFYSSLIILFEIQAIFFKENDIYSEG